MVNRRDYASSTDAVGMRHGYDRAGNMTTTPKPDDWNAHFDLTYDAWNRLVKVEDGEDTVAEYQYDGRHYRIVKKTCDEMGNWKLGQSPIFSSLACRLATKQERKIGDCPRFPDSPILGRTTMYRLACSAAVAAAIGLISSAHSAAAPEEANVDEDAATVCDEFRESDWRLLFPWATGSKIERIRLVIIRTLFSKQAVDVTFDDEKLLAKIQSALETDPLRLATPPDGSVRGGWGCLAVGRLYIDTTETSFYVAIDYSGFALDEVYPTSSTAFWSGRLAKVVDDIYFSETKQHLPNKMLRRLAGYERIYVDSKWLQDDE